MTKEEMEESISKISLILAHMTRTIKMLQEIATQTQQDIEWLKNNQSGTIESASNDPA